jgi:hypothetical protein
MKTLIRFTLPAAIFILPLVSCGIDTNIDYDDAGAAVDRITRSYNIIVQEPDAKGGMSVTPNPAKQGGSVIISYLAPEEAAAVNYTIVSITGTYNDGQKTINTAKTAEGGGGDGNLSCPPLTYT